MCQSTGVFVSTAGFPVASLFFLFSNSTIQSTMTHPDFAISTNKL